MKYEHVCCDCGQRRWHSNPSSETKRCRDCYNKKRAADSPYKGLSSADRVRKERYAHYFSMSLEDYDAILELQAGGCAICGKHAVNQHLGIDHVHATGLVRGILCRNCNRGVGMFHDDAELLTRAARYLESPPAVAAIGERFGRKGRVTNKRKPRRKSA